MKMPQKSTFSEPENNPMEVHFFNMVNLTIWYNFATLCISKMQNYPYSTKIYIYTYFLFF